jgi:hypothetical protein
MPFDTPTNYPGIIIRMNSQADSVMFPTLVNQALAQIANTITGHKLLQGIANRVGQAKFGYTVCIQRANMTYNPACETKWVGTNVAKTFRRNKCNHSWGRFNYGYQIQSKYDKHS